MDLTNLSSNWKKLQPTIIAEKAATNSPDRPQKRKRSNAAAAPPPRKKSKSIYNPSNKLKQRTMNSTSTEQTLQASTAINAGLSPTVEIGKYVALDCEMVGVGPPLHSNSNNGNETITVTESALARVSIVNYNGEQVYDSYVLPKEPVTDWRTPVSGIRPSHMKYARSFEEVQATVAEILRGRVVVGHSLRHDFKALLLDHPLRDVRDTSRHAPYRKLVGGTPKLSLLAAELLGLEIQTGEHSSLEDARACMLLFRRDKDIFETKKVKGKRR